MGLYFGGIIILLNQEILKKKHSTYMFHYSGFDFVLKN